MYFQGTLSLVTQLLEVPVLQKYVKVKERGKAGRLVKRGRLCGRPWKGQAMFSGPEGGRLGPGNRKRGLEA